MPRKKKNKDIKKKTKNKERCKYGCFLLNLQESVLNYV